MKLVRRAAHCESIFLQILVWLAVFVGSQARGAAAERAPKSSASWLHIDARADPCVSERELSREVEDSLAREPHDGVRVEAAARGRGWVVELWHAAGEYAVREFPVLPEECSLRVRALALSIALAVEHADSAPTKAPEEREPSASSSPFVGWAVGLNAGASMGELPSAAALLGLEVRIVRGRWVPLELRALADVWTAEVSFAGARLATRQVLAALGSCVGPRESGAWRVDFCLGSELGAALGRANGVARPKTDPAGAGALNLGLASRWSPRPRFALTARLEGFARFWTPRFRLLEANGAVFAERELPRAGGRLWLGFAWLSK